MANTPVEFFAPSGLALTLKLYAQSSANTLAGSFAATEQTVSKGYYLATVNTPLVGAYNARATLADDTTIAGFAIDLLDNLDVHRPAQENPPTRSNVRQWLSTSVALRTVNQFIWDGSSWILTQPNLPHVSGNVAHFAGYPAANFIHAAGEFPELHSHVHGFSEEALQEIVDSISTMDSLLFIASMVGADVVIDKETDPTCYHLVYFISETATEIARKELRDIDGAKINTDTKIPRQLLEVAAP